MSERLIYDFVSKIGAYDLPSGCTFAEFLVLLEKCVESVPLEKRDNLKVDWMGYDAGHIEFRLGRDETDEELGRRVAWEAKREAECEARERAQLNRLRQKYGA